MKLERAFTIVVTNVNEKPTAIQVTIRSQSKIALTDLSSKDNNVITMMMNKTSPTKKVTH